MLSTRLAMILLGSLLGAAACNAKANPNAPVPAPNVDAARASSSGRETAVISGGCFWEFRLCFNT